MSCTTFLDKYIRLLIYIVNIHLLIILCTNNSNAKLQTIVSHCMHSYLCKSNRLVQYFKFFCKALLILVSFKEEQFKKIKLH